MKYYFPLITACYFLLSCESGIPVSKDPPPSDTIGIENLIQVPSTKCYETITKGDTFKLTIDVYSDVVAGILEYRYRNKTQMVGQLQGIRSGDTLIADYIYIEGGRENAKQVAFILEDVFAIEGQGPMEDHNGKKYFTDKSKLEFKKGLKILRQDCYNPESSTFSGLAGIWELTFLDGLTTSVDSLYPEKKPHLLFTSGVRDQFSGHTSCNNLRGMFEEQGKSFRFKEPFSMTKMYCEGNGEKPFLQMLIRVDAYAIQQDELTFFQQNRPIMRFSRK